MKLYLIDFTDRGFKSRKAWAGTQAEAKQRHKELCDEYERFNVDEPVMVEVPTDKPGLLDWLNANVYNG